jgi:hypothetical protein
MGLFSRKRKARPLQIPDDLAARAAMQYAAQEFASAFVSYTEAIDKIHAMCVVTVPRYRERTPGEPDRRILEGLNDSLAAALAVNPRLEVASAVEHTMRWLGEIADEAGASAGLYLDAIRNIETTYRRGRG